LSQSPGISVIAPAYNAAGFYEGWLRSIQQQEYDNLEVVLVDDGSTDELPRLIRTAPSYFRCLRQDNRGPASARNTALKSCGGDLVAFLDLDDRWTPGHLQRLSRALLNQPDAGIAQGLIRNIACGADDISYYCSHPYRFINLGCAVFRRWVFEKAGVFDETLTYAEDFDFMIRCWEQGVRKIDVDELSLLYYRHGRNMTNGKTPIDLGGVLIYKRHLDRLRAGRVDLKMPWRLGIGYPEYMGRSVFPFDEGLREPIAWLPPISA
jgi:glycosyltransferase involved in cell wall biosynthesis